MTTLQFTEQQQGLVDAIERNEARHMAILGQRGTGMTYMAAWAAVHYATTYPAAKVICTAPSLLQTQDILGREIERRLKEMNLKFKRSAAGSFKIGEMQEPSILLASPYKVQNFMGYMGNPTVFIADCADGLEDDILPCMTACASQPKDRVLAFSHKGEAARDSKFAEFWSRADYVNHWCCIPR